MKRRLLLLVVTSALLSVALVALYDYYFSDILPLASTDDTQFIWRFEAAFLVTATIRVSTAVSALSAVSLLALLCAEHADKLNRP